MPSFAGSLYFAGRLGRLGMVAAVFIVSGCHKKPEPPVAPVPKPTPVVTSKPSVPLPARQPGLWETRVTEQGSAGGAQILQICIDADTDRRLGILGTDLSGDTCTRRTVSLENNGSWGLLAECTMVPGVVTEYSGAITIGSDQTYDMKVRAQTTGANQLNRVTNYVVTSKRLGGCKAGQAPGDIVNDGVKMNLFDMAGVKRDRKSAGPVGDAGAATKPADDVVD
ncbi:DUF3617 domain-containing protein [Asticcacaulis sp. AC466]|uniref:DUF3617 domain-containing protein n=1 Tax=Asticcacaulis sp. AC466 TaxID=1282362 RepID=UPI00068D6E3B|nr:DUF3617 family protein [Asticcacaulis sp. AC466]